MTKEEKISYYDAYREANKDKTKAYYQANRDGLATKKKAYYQANKEKAKARAKAYQKANKDKVKDYQKDYYEANKDKLKAKNKAYYQAYREANKHKINSKEKAWRKANKVKINSRLKNKRKTDTLFKLKCNLRSRTSKALKSKGYKKESKTAKTLGASYRIVKKHLERQFTDGMNWENYGEWHVDHIIPLASANTKDELINLCHFRNLQPLWAADNLSKGCRIE